MTAEELELARRMAEITDARETINGQVPLDDGLRFPGNGMPARADSLASSWPGWSRLAKDSALGQTSQILYDADVDVTQYVPVQILELNGKDLDATQVQLVLGQPYVIPRTPASLQGENLQTVSGGFDNAGMAGFGDFPGTADPITWPPLCYVIEWGVGGARSRAYVDAINGAAVNLTCSFLRVYGVVPPDAANMPGTSGLYVLSAFVGPGVPRSGTAQRTIYVGEVAGGAESDVFMVPPFAKRASLIAATQAAGTPAEVTAGWIRFWQDPAGTICIGNYFITGNQPGPFNVPNGGQYFSLVSGLTADADFAACFELAI